jgi:chlorophyllide a reductase subunit Z
LPVTSVLHYTDALPPHELPIVVTGLGEEELGQDRHRRRDEARLGVLDPNMPAVVVTGSIAEMIGGGVTPEGTNIANGSFRAPSTRISGRAPTARSDLAVEAVRRQKDTEERAARRPDVKPRVNIIGPIYGTFNMPSDLAEIRRLSRVSAAEVNMVFPLGSHLADVPKLADADVNICMYREFGRSCAKRWSGPICRHRSGCDSTTKFLRKLGELPASTRSRSSSARSTPRSSRCGICGAR